MKKYSTNFDFNSDMLRDDVKDQSHFENLVLLRLNVPVNNFSVKSGRSHRFLGITSTFRRVNGLCSRTQHEGGRY